VDLFIVFVVLTSVWSLRFLGVPDVGTITMVVGLALVFGLLRFRGQSAGVIGLNVLPPTRQLLAETGRLLPWFAVAWLVGGLIGIDLYGQPQASTAVTLLPESFFLAFLDVTLITRVLIGFGEEVVFRGFVLQRLLCLTGEEKSGKIMACAPQAVWFGALHASQGGAGMIMTGFIGFAFAWFYLSRAERNLWPLILLHGATDSIVLSASWLMK